MIKSVKPFEYGFVVICHNTTTDKIKTTVRSIQFNYPNKQIICCLPKDGNVDIDVPVIKGGNSFISILNNGMKKAPCKAWNFFIKADHWLSNHLEQRFLMFTENEKDIIFPIKNGKTSFIDFDLSCLLLHHTALKEIGAFHDTKHEVARALWAATAIYKGYKFKTLLGTVI